MLHGSGLLGRSDAGAIAVCDALSGTDATGAIASREPGDLDSAAMGLN
jgi:hypothetical protein